MTPLASMSPTLRDDDFGSIAGPLRIAGFFGRLPTRGWGGWASGSLVADESRSRTGGRGNAVTAHHPLKGAQRSDHRRGQGVRRIGSPSQTP